MGAISTLRLPDHRPTAEINITPLIDVMLALLLIFMLATPVLTKRLVLPQGGEPARNNKPYVLDLSITSQGEVLRDGYVLSRLELQAELAALGSRQGDHALKLHPDAATSHQNLIAVMALADNANVGPIELEMPQH